MVMLVVLVLCKFMGGNVLWLLWLWGLVFVGNLVGVVIVVVVFVYLLVFIFEVM